MNAEIKNAESKTNIKVSWWRYPVAVIAFVVIQLFLPGIISLVDIFLDTLNPNYLKHGAVISALTGYILSAIIANDCVSRLVKGSSLAFCVALPGLYAIYISFVSAFNYQNGMALEDAICLLVSAVINVGYIIVLCTDKFRHPQSAKTESPDQSSSEFAAK